MSTAALTYPPTGQAGLELQADRRPVSPKTGTVGVMTSGTAYTTPIPNKIMLNITTSTSVTLTMLDGNTVNLGSLPIGFFQLDIEATTVTLGTGADGVIAGFYDIPGG